MVDRVYNGTQRSIDKFESISFRDASKIFFVPLYQLLALDDEMFGTRAADNQGKAEVQEKMKLKGILQALLQMPYLVLLLMYDSD